MRMSEKCHNKHNNSYNSLTNRGKKSTYLRRLLKYSSLSAESTCPLITTSGACCPAAETAGAAGAVAATAGAAARTDAAESLDPAVLNKDPLMGSNLEMVSCHRGLLKNSIWVSKNSMAFCMSKLGSTGMPMMVPWSGQGHPDPQREHFWKINMEEKLKFKTLYETSVVYKITSKNAIK